MCGAGLDLNKNSSYLKDSEEDFSLYFLFAVEQ